LKFEEVFNLGEEGYVARGEGFEGFGALGGVSGWERGGVRGRGIEG